MTFPPLDPENLGDHEQHSEIAQDVEAHVGKARVDGFVRQRRGDEEKAERDLDAHREPGRGERFLRRHDSGPVTLDPLRLTQSGQPSRYTRRLLKPAPKSFCASMCESSQSPPEQ